MQTKAGSRATRTKFKALVVALVVGTTLVVFVSAPSPAHADSFEARFLYLVNQERSAKGLHRLSIAGDLAPKAERHSAEMAARRRIWHSSNLASGVRNWEVLGENVGMGPSVEALHRAFMQSARHRYNVLRPGFEQVGIGAIQRDDTIYVTFIFVERMHIGAASAPRTKPYTLAIGSAAQRSNPDPNPELVDVRGSFAPSATERVVPSWPAVSLRFLAMVGLAFVIGGIFLVGIDRRDRRVRRRRERVAKLPLPQAQPTLVDYPPIVLESLHEFDRVPSDFS
jgi:uncharacterized protein YkwD